MANRRKPRVADWQPRKFRGSYHMPGTADEARKTRTTVRCAPNPFYEGLYEAKQAGAKFSRAKALYSARHETTRFQDVCSDREQQARHERHRKWENRMKFMALDLDRCLEEIK